ncbi:MAG TPA: hypothetical protein VKO83_02375 [Steroidobacteraceae bacterium]|nr:hypothetical protein [Steroidobacteraceae bacterium]
MNKLIAALALTAAAATAPAFAGNVGISISVGEPGFYGQIDIGGYGRPALIYSEPVVLAPRYRAYAPVYIRAPRDHYRHWDRYCGRYNACYRPVYFVRDEWYSNYYSPRYRQHYHSRDDRRDYRWDNRRDRRDWREDRRDDRRGRRDDHRDDRNDWRDHH